MTTHTIPNQTSGKVLIKKCHVCGHIMEQNHEIQKCDCCKKSFLPLNYFGKVHKKFGEEYQELFSSVDELHEDDLIKGVNVIW